MKRFYALNKAFNVSTTVSRLCLFAFFLLMSSLLFINKSYATHAAGSDISYKWVSGNTYQVTVSFYRSCAGVAAPTNITLDINSVSLGVSLQQTLDRIPGTGQEISHPCTSVQTNCVNSSSTLNGIQQYVYQGNVTLPGPAVDWIFSYGICCRNCAISTIVHPNPCNSSNTTPELYVQAFLNSVAAPTNSSPTFTVLPVGFICWDQPFTYNQGALDQEGDSLTYQLITPKTSSTGTVQFIAPFSATNFITSSPAATLNTATGQLNMTPTDSGQVGILAILVNQYHNGVLVGSTIRDMQFDVIQCVNHNPTATGINGSTTDYADTVCPGTHVHFTINSSDNTPGLKVTLSWNSGIAGATFDTATAHGNSYPTGTFDWPSAVARTQPYTFVVTVMDNGCSYNASQSYVFTIMVTDIQSTITTSNYNGYQISCNGANNGTDTVNQYDGTSPYTYSWSGPNSYTSTKQTNSGLAPGTYTVTITDSRGCTAGNSVILLQPNAVTAAVNVVTDVACYGASTGKDSVSASGGVSPYKYKWSNNATTQDISNVAAGPYTVTVTDANGCTTVKSDTIRQPQNPIVVTMDTADSKPVGCNGESSGSLAITVSGGTLPYTYSWSNGASTQDISEVPANLYTVTVTDANGCTGKLSDSVKNGAFHTLITATTIHGYNITCFGAATGTASVTVLGGTAPFTYSWSNGATTSTTSGLKAGPVSVTVFDQNGCSNIATDTLTQPIDSFFVAVDSFFNVSCNGTDNGAIYTSVSGGLIPYTYNWSNSATTQNITGLDTGTYTITVTDSLGCIATTSQSITEPPVLTVTTMPTDTSGYNIKCHGESTGGFIATVSGGAPPYTYQWNNGGITDTITGLPAGTPAIHYDATITDANGCTATSFSTDTLTQPDTIVPLITSAIVKGGANLLCNGDSTGTASVVVTGGTPPYNFTWSNGQSATGVLTDTVTNLKAGVVTVFVSDQNGCSVTASDTIIQPAPITATDSVTDITCNGAANGAIYLTPAGGTGSYTFSWSNTATSQNLTGLIPGDYGVTITDANSCTGIDTGIIVTQPDSLLITTTITDVSCNGNGDGSIVGNITGGTSLYTVTFPGDTFSTAGGFAFNILTPGVYVISVVDANGCSATQSDTITQPNVLTDSLFAISPLCSGNVFNDTIVETTSGGTSPYTYSWSNSATTQGLIGVAPGEYYVTVTDFNGCSVIDSAFLTTPTPITDTIISLTAINCFGSSTGGLKAINVTGGTPPYSYFWTNESTADSSIHLKAGSTYDVTITDSLGCLRVDSATVPTQPQIIITPTINSPTCSNQYGTISLSISGGTGSNYTYSWSNGATVAALDSLLAGIYTVTVTDSIGCQQADTFNLKNLTLILDTVVTQPDCISSIVGAIQVTPSGGTAPYTYSWSNGATTASIDSLSAGYYSLTVTDSTGCSNSIDSIKIKQCCHLTIIPAVINASACDTASGSASVSVSGGTGNFTYSWSTGASTDTVTGLVRGTTYFVTVQDVSGCSGDTSFTVGQDLPIVVTNGGAINPGACGEGIGAVIIASASGGEPPYTFAWSDTSGNNYTTSSDTLTNIFPSVYCLNSVTDSRGCTALGPLFCDTVKSAPTAPQITTAPTFTYDSTCSQTSTVTIDFSNADISGGTPPYSIMWSNGATTDTLTTVPAGTFYTLTITDSKGCKDSTTVLVPPNTPLSFLQASSVSPLCPTLTSSDSINISYSGGLAPYSVFLQGLGDTYSFTISGFDTTVAVNDDIYNVYVTDSRGCTDSATGVLIFPSNVPLTALPIPDSVVTCPNNHDGAFELVTVGGTPPYTITITGNGVNITTSNDDTVIASLGAGIYTINVSDANGCSTSTADTLIPEFNLSAVANIIKPLLCNSSPNDSASIIVTGGSGSYSFNWGNGLSTDTVGGLAAGTYVVSVSDLINGCDTTVTVTIDSSLALTASIGNVTNTTCGATCNGVATVTASGGIPPYSYLWSNNGTNATDSGLCAGIDSVTVTDLFGCSLVRAVTIIGPSKPLTASISATHDTISCAGVSSSDTLTVTPSGGVQSYTYSWSNGSSNSSITVNSGGGYCVTVTDAGGCSVVSCDTIISQTTPPTLSFNVTNITTCHSDSTGSITVTPSGNPGPFSYRWNNNDSTQTINNLKLGSYTVTVTYGSGCTVSGSATVTAPTAITVSLNFTYTNNCDTASAANINIDTASAGGTPPYTWVWSVAGNNNDPSLFGIASNATYSVTVTDANGCTAVDSQFIPHNYHALTDVKDSSISPLCATSNGSIIVTWRGSFSPFTVGWGTGSSSVSGNTTTLILPAGIYTVTVTDSTGCSAVGNTDTIKVPPQFTDSITATTVNLCAGISSDTIISSVSGGTQGYTYSWSTGQTTANLDGVGSGSYTQTVTDANGCSAISNTIVLRQSPPIAANLSFVYDSICSPTSPVSVYSNPTGGVKPYTYMWSTGATIDSLSNVTAGIQYKITVTDSVGCNTIDSITIAPNTPLSNLLANPNTVLCYNSPGTITISFTGGTAPYTILVYNLNTNTTQTINGVQSQDTTISVIDTDAYNITVENGTCSQSQDFIIFSPPAKLTDSIMATTVNACAGVNGDTILSSVSGGMPGYTYSWSNHDTTANLYGVGAGTYTQTVTDANGCTAVSNTIIIKQNLPIAANLSFVYDSICSPTSPVSVYSNPTGGVKPYTYMWSTGATIDSLSNVTAGIQYKITVTDSVGCNTIDSITIAPNTPLSNLLANPNTVLCYNSPGTITISFTGGTAPYTILVYNLNTNTTQTINGVQSQDTTISVIDTDAYNITVENGTCSQSQDFIIFSPPAKLTDSIMATTVNACAGVNGDTILSSVSGGMPGYTYSWSNHDTTANLYGVGAGTYTQTVTDANGCTAVSNTIIIKQNLPIAANLSFVYDSICSPTSPVSVYSNPTGGVKPYTYMWSTGATIDSLSNVTAGIQYKITVTDSVGCNTIDSITIAPNTPLSNLLANPNTVLCYNSPGTITISFTGGTAPYTILVYNLNTNTTQTINGVQSQDTTISVIDTDAYNITVENGTCSQSQDFIIFSPPAQLTDTIVATTVNLCFGTKTDTIISTVSGGTGNYTYSWSTGQTTANLDGVGAGTYTETVTDANGCSAVSNTIILKQGTPLNGNLSFVYDSICSPTSPVSVYSNPTGGVKPYTYMWSTGATIDSLSNVTAGIQYKITVTDSVGCNTIDSITIAPNTPLSNLLANPNTVLCYNSPGTITISFTGGTAPYTILVYNLNTNTTQTINGVQSQDTTISVIDTDAYNITVENGTCSQSQDFIIFSPPAKLTDSIAATTVNLCFGTKTDTIISTVSGGTGGYTYTWSTGQTTANLDGVGAGTYTQTVTDANGCTTVSNTIILKQGTPINANLSFVYDSVCSPTSTASVFSNPTGGVPPYTYKWSTGATIDSLSKVVASIKYYITVTDSIGCDKVDSISLNPNTPLANLLANPSTVLCSYTLNGTITITFNGGTPPYTILVYNLSTNTTETINGVQSQDTAITVIDTDAYNITVENGPCSLSEDFIIFSPPLPLVIDTSGVVPPTCPNSHGGTFTYAVNGGTSPYSILVAGTSTTNPDSTISDLAAGTYQIVVTDFNGCSADSAVVLKSKNHLAVTIDTTQKILCNSTPDGSLTAAGSLGSGSYSYKWSNGKTTAVISGLGYGTYTVTVTDNTTGCDTSATVTLDTASALQASISGIVDATCAGTCNGQATVTATGGVGSYTYHWSDGGTNATTNTLCEGTDSVTVSDGTCQVVRAVKITGPSKALSLAFTVVNATGAGQGSLTVTPSGGTSPYTYSWSGGSTKDSINRVAGTYCVTVTDANGCSTSGCDTIKGGCAGLSVSYYFPDTIRCFGGTAVIEVTVGSGVAPYTYSWSNGKSTITVNNTNTDTVTASTYSVTVTDVNGCSSAISNIAVNGPSAAVTASINLVSPVQCNGTGACLSAAGSGGTPGYSYLWSYNSSTTDTICGIASGTTLSVTVTDAAGCSAASASYPVNQPSGFVVTVIQKTPSCGTSCNGSVIIEISGNNDPTPEYKYSWTGCDGSFTSTRANPTNMCPCIYDVTVTDENTGCIGSAIDTITLSPAVTVKAGDDTTVCSGVVNLVGTASTSSPATVDSIVWSELAPANATFTSPVSAYSTTAAIATSDTSTFVFTAGNSYGCVASDSVTVIFNNLVANPGPDITLNCADDNNNSVQLQATLPAGATGLWTTETGYTVDLSSTSDPHATIGKTTPNSHNIMEWTITEGNCTASDTMTIYNSCLDTTIIIPTGFTPNGDGVNDYFVIQGLQYYMDNELKVFNRWGNEVYDHVNYDNTWGGTDNNGNKLPDGTYFVVFTSPHNNYKYARYVDLRRQ